jgi:hypothetical protein
MISYFRRDIDEICALLGNYAALSGSSVPTFRDNLSVPSSRLKKSKKFSNTERSWKRETKNPSSYSVVLCHCFVFPEDETQM